LIVKRWRMSWFNKLVAQTLPVIPKPIVRQVSARYIAGETLEEALSLVRSLNRAGMMATLDILGEFVTGEKEAHRAGEEYVSVLRAIDREGLDSNVSLKLTQMGLKLDVELCYEMTLKVMKEAERRDNFVRIDMEDSSCTDDTLLIYRRLLEQFGNRVGCVLQAYLKRSGADLEPLLPRSPNVRLCKGIYIEPPAIAFQDHDEINRNFIQVTEQMIAGGAYAGIATHDKVLVAAAFDLIEKYELPRDRYEFQMLLGVRESLRQSILDRGHRLRVYVPYGSHWYAYSLRRLKENPQIAGHVIRGLLNGKH
jgi:proline dehydrogenase